MQAGIVTFVEFLKQTGFIEGFKHGATRRTVHDILESETMDLVLDRVIQIINRNRNQYDQLAAMTKEGIKLIAKLVLEYPIQIQKFNESKASASARTIDLVISDALITDVATRLSCSNEAAEFVTKVFFQTFHDQQMLNKPLYSVGNSIGDYSISFSRSVIEESCCDCFGFFKKSPPTSQYENINIVDVEGNINHDHPGLRRRMIHN